MRTSLSQIGAPKAPPQASPWCGGLIALAILCAAPLARAADEKPKADAKAVDAAPPPSSVVLPSSSKPAAGQTAVAKAASQVGGDTADVISVHVIEKRPFTEANRWELSLFGPVQINSKFTMHAGAALEVAYHLRENVAVQLSGVWYPYAAQSSLTEELVTKVRQQPLAANALLIKGGAMAGLELMPVYGKINIFDGKILRLGFYLNAGLGAASTSLQLRAANTEKGRSYGDTGVRLMAALGAGFRVYITERLTLRAEIRDQVYSAYVSKVNGCSYADTRSVYTSGAGATVSQGCSASSFGDTEAEVKNNAAIASDQMKEPSADVINNLAAYTGLSYLF